MTAATAAARLVPVVGRILAARQAVPTSRSVLAALTGIDGCGKGYLAARLVEALQAGGLRVAPINIDGWLNLPAVRFSRTDPAAHFYQHAIRFDALFAELVLPLRQRRSLRVEFDFAEETATSFRRQTSAFEDIDVIVLEGIYLLKRAFVHHYDVAVWIDCSFDTALERALARGQEGLPQAETIAAYRTIYFPAQEIHLARDQPRQAASAIVVNDSRLQPQAGSA
ncbi:MAG: uridine kinase family protein [Candidatus Binatia bacterium]